MAAQSPLVVSPTAFTLAIASRSVHVASPAVVLSAVLLTVIVAALAEHGTSAISIVVPSATAVPRLALVRPVTIRPSFLSIFQMAEL